MYAQLRRCGQDLVGVGRLSIRDASGDHWHFKPMLTDRLDKRWKILSHADRVDMPAVAHGKIYAVETQVGRSLSELLSVQELKMLGKNGDFQARGGGRPVTAAGLSDCGTQQGATRIEHRTPG
jgi:hypothetical protein